MLPVVSILGILGNVRGMRVCLGCCVLCCLGSTVSCLLCNPLSLLSCCLRAAHNRILHCLHSSATSHQAMSMMQGDIVASRDRCQGAWKVREDHSTHLPGALGLAVSGAMRHISSTAEQIISSNMCAGRSSLRYLPMIQHEMSRVKRQVCRGNGGAGGA